MNDVSIKHPEWLYIDVDGKTSYGYDQEWFTDEWQRLSGCGPTSASQVLSYSLFRDGLLDLETTSDQTLALERMNLVWKYVKPRFGGGCFIRLNGWNVVLLVYWRIKAYLMMYIC